jgi:hypothetical protein
MAKRVRMSQRDSDIIGVGTAVILGFVVLGAVIVVLQILILVLKFGNWVP